MSIMVQALNGREMSEKRYHTLPEAFINLHEAKRLVHDGIYAQLPVESRSNLPVVLYMLLEAGFPRKPGVYPMFRPSSGGRPGEKPYFHQ